MINCSIASGKYVATVSSIALICLLLAIWSFCFIPNTATKEIFSGNFFGFLCVLPCLATSYVAYLVWKSISKQEPKLLKTALTIAVIIVFCLLGFAFDYGRHYDNWYDTYRMFDNTIIPAQYEVFNFGFRFMEDLTFGLGYIAPFIATFLSYMTCFLLYYFIIIKK